MNQTCRVLRLLSALVAGWVLLAATAHAQTVLLPDRWRFSPNEAPDRPEYREPAFDDGAWKEVSVPSAWEREGYDTLDGIRWYRVRFSVDDALVGKPLRLLLGKIDDADETWLNGQPVGRSGAFPPRAVTAFSEMRIYRLSDGLLKKDNVLAVRVHDGGGAGGICQGPVGLYNDGDYDLEFRPPPGPRASYHQPVTTNGLIAAVYDTRRDQVLTVSPHVFQAYDQGQLVKPFLQHLQPVGLGSPLSASYVEHTHVVRVRYPAAVEITYLAPFTTGEKVFHACVSGPTKIVSAMSFRWHGGAGTLLTDGVTFHRPGGRSDRYFLFGFTDAHHGDGRTVARSRAHLEATGGRLVEAEVRFMRNLHASCRLPADTTPAERATLEQSISVLKMAQVSEREVFPEARGQLLASLPPGCWNITWVRDGMYGILALNRLGLYSEARRALEFQLRATSGQYERFLDRSGRDVGVGVPYRISVCRYFGRGKEESDDVDGPNIELDGFGLFLVAFSDYVSRSGDEVFFRRWQPLVRREVAAPILHIIDDNGLIRGESGPWERHLRFKQFAYTSIGCAAGLRDFVALERRLGGPEAHEVARHQQAADRLRTAIRTRLVTTAGWIKANAEARDADAYDSFDGGTFEAFILGSEPLFAEPRLFATHLAAYEKALRVPGPRRGFARINKGDWYETAEWILLDLRISAAMARFGRAGEARALFDWVTDQATLNHHLLPELYTLQTQGYDGSVPMVGFGAGAYVLTSWDLRERR